MHNRNTGGSVSPTYPLSCWRLRFGKHFLRYAVLAFLLPVLPLSGLLAQTAGSSKEVIPDPDSRPCLSYRERSLTPLAQ